MEKKEIPFSLVRSVIASISSTNHQFHNIILPVSYAHYIGSGSSAQRQGGCDIMNWLSDGFWQGIVGYNGSHDWGGK